MLNAGADGEYVFIDRSQMTSHEQHVENARRRYVGVRVLLCVLLLDLARSVYIAHRRLNWNAATPLDRFCPIVSVILPTMAVYRFAIEKYMRLDDVHDMSDFLFVSLLLVGGFVNDCLVIYDTPLFGTGFAFLTTLKMGGMFIVCCNIYFYLDSVARAQLERSDSSDLSASVIRRQGFQNQVDFMRMYSQFVPMFGPMLKLFVGSKFKRNRA